MQYWSVHYLILHISANACKEMFIQSCLDVCVNSILGYQSVSYCLFSDIEPTCHQSVLYLSLGVGIPVTFLLTAIISSLLTLLITYQCLTRRRSHVQPAAAVYDHVSVSCSISNSYVVYGAVPPKNNSIFT